MQSSYCARVCLALRFPVLDSRDALKLAERIFSVVAHEWRHIRDDQRGLRFDSHDIPYWYRCQEIRARRSQKLAGKNLHKMERAQEAVLNLAINIEEVVDEKEKRNGKSGKEKEERKKTGNE